MRLWKESGNQRRNLCFPAGPSSANNESEMDKDEYESDNSRVNVFVRVRPAKGKEEKATRQAGEKSVRISVTKKRENRDG